MMKRMTKKIFLSCGNLHVCSGVLLLLIWALPLQIHASIKLKGEHVTNKLTCRDCHHEYQKGYSPPAGVKLTTRECSLCHMYGAKKITKFEDLPRITKILHLRCVKCHEAYLLRGNNEKLRAILQMRPAAAKGDTVSSGAPQGTRQSSQCLVCH